jgi:heptosyltransferase-2
MHILLVRFSSMGDVVLQTATLNWLKTLFGSSLQVTFVTSREFVSLIDGHPVVKRVVSFDRRQEKWSQLVSSIKAIHSKEPIDLILDVHATMRSFRLKLAMWWIPQLTVDKRRWERFLLTKLKGVHLKRLVSAKIFGLEPQVERIITDFEGIFGDSHGKRRTIEYRKGPHQELTSLKPLPAYDVPSPYVVVAPSASFFYKRWPIDYFVELTKSLLQKTKLNVVILAGPSDDFCQKFNDINDSRLFNLQGKTSLQESMSVLAHGKLCIGNDSGMNHIAEAYGVPVVTIFGPTDPRFGFAPHGKESIYLSREPWCKPCSTTGSTPCYRKRHFCMEEISVHEVEKEALRILGAEHAL